MISGDEVGTILNDVHSRLNNTRVRSVVRPRDLDELRAALRHAADRRLPVSVAGGRHAMGGQQFCEGGVLIDMTAMCRPISLDTDRGLLEMEAGALWPDVIAATHALQGDRIRWAIRQKQTGADDISLGGSVASNGHGRGLLMQPIVDDIEALDVLTADGELVRCSREQHPELFSLVVGGYGLFGIVVNVTLRLRERIKLRRVVNVQDVDEAIPTFYRRVSEGYLYGDFQVALEPRDEDFLRRGVLACYRAAPDDEPLVDSSASLSREQWLGLLRLAATDKRRAFQAYSQHYLATHGNVYWSDVMQLSTYLPSYVEVLEEVEGGGSESSSLVIGEMYTPPDRLLDFLEMSRRILRQTGADDLYGTIRAIRKDETSFLPWARDDFGCVIFNLRTRHTPAGVGHTTEVFRNLIQAAMELGGSFFLTYGRAATREQLERCYPGFPEFLRRKRQYDPDLRFQSEWWRHYAPMFE